MPVVHKIRLKWKVKVYADDHPPPHFHVVGPDCDIKFEIDGFARLAGAGPADIVDEALAWAATHSLLLKEKWAEYNEREDE